MITSPTELKAHNRHVAFHAAIAAKAAALQESKLAPRRPAPLPTATVVEPTSPVIEVGARSLGRPWFYVDEVYPLKQPKVRDIQEFVAFHHSTPLTQFLSERRLRRLARPRQIAMYLCRELTGRSLPEIGRRFRRDHTTVMHGIRQIEAMINPGGPKFDPEIAAKVTALRAGLERTLG